MATHEGGVDGGVGDGGGVGDDGGGDEGGRDGGVDGGVGGLRSREEESERCEQKVLLTLFAFLLERVRALLRFDVDDVEIEFFYDERFDESTR